jgi:hypothetical protein
VVVVVLVSALVPTVSAHASVPPRRGFNLVFSSLPSSSKWLFDLGTGYPGGAAN